MESSTKFALIIAFSIIGILGLALLVVMLQGVRSSFTDFLRRMFRRTFNPLDDKTKTKTKLPRSIQQALKQLESVTEKRQNRNPDTESESAQCPICLQLLYPKQGAPTPAAGANEGTEGEAAITVEIQPQEKEPAQPAQPASPTPSIDDDEALMLKQCRHIFHSRCLVGWFLRKKHNCPVCRAKYYQPAQKATSGDDYRRRSVPPLLPVYSF
ncbi:hypothetical protein GGR53DRAFT_96272 [Hypoxylon sp. FL1150]|nr:hypothetical protein GGR53DRAFT_96272 [Hypoxylon sp. FL1150]